MSQERDEDKKMMLETLTGDYIEVTRPYLETARRHQLVEFLEMRGSACYDDESTELLREAALDDWDSENIDLVYSADPM
tara:strand:+ start:1894 stop:2130 length:237 start_codon:yes stop_codon:yes gene_type:complete